MQFLHSYDTIGDIVLERGEDSCGNSECIPSGDGSLDALHIPVQTEVAALPSPAAPTSPSASSVLPASRLSHNPGSGSLNGAGSCGGGTTDEAAMIEAAMLAAEDAEDAEAMHAARFEAQHEMNKVDDSRPATSSSSPSSSSSGTASAGAGAGAGAGGGGDADDDASTVAGTSASSSNAESAVLSMPLITSIGWLRNTVT